MSDKKTECCKPRLSKTVLFQISKQDLVPSLRDPHSSLLSSLKNIMSIWHLTTSYHGKTTHGFYASRKDAEKHLRRCLRQQVHPFFDQLLQHAQGRLPLKYRLGDPVMWTSTQLLEYQGREWVYDVYLLDKPLSFGRGCFPDMDYYKRLLRDLGNPESEISLCKLPHEVLYWLSDFVNDDHSFSHTLEPYQNPHYGKEYASDSDM